jgi:pantoate--beta-alanine ligase
LPALSSQDANSVPRRPRVVSNIPALRRAVGALRRSGATVALIPTMGALHDGHLSLVRLARRRARRVVVSIFVNPTQFAPNEDLASYPRTLSKDLVALADAGVDLVWAPDVKVMYPPDFATRIAPEGPAKAGLEDAFRPHFFSGVATVVAKLLLQCAPDVAVFGEKDYQQLKVVTRLAADLDLPVKIVGAPIVREANGLAMSSRNAYLTQAQRGIAATLYRVLSDCARRIAATEQIARVLDEGAAEIESVGFTLDYLEARHADSLAKVERLDDGPIRLLVAARLGSTRLIDNVAVLER